MRVVVFAYHNMGIAGLNALRRAGYEHLPSIFSHNDDPEETAWFGSVKKWGGGQGIPRGMSCGDTADEMAGRYRGPSAGNDFFPSIIGI